jgi:hypothetical protein
MIRPILRRRPGVRTTRKSRLSISSEFLLGALLLLCASSSWSQAFQKVPGLSFTMPYGAVNPLPQVLASASTGTNFSFTATVSTTSGGSWLQLNGSTNSLYPNTPDAISVGVSAAGLTAGTYTGDIVLTPSSSSIATMTVPVTLAICSSTAALFDNRPGEMSFSLVLAINWMMTS